MSEKTNYHSGFVTLIGRPNVGKSTLLNRLVGEKISIVSDKPQTTRNRIQCILTRPDGQVIFLDTPGIHKPKHRLGEMMVKTAENTIGEVDLVLYVVSADAPEVGTGDRFIQERLAGSRAPIFLVVNKIDLVSAEEVAGIVEAYSQGLKLAGVFAISALVGTEVERLSAAIMGTLPEGPQYYPDDMITDQPERFIVGELIREKVLHSTREEVPHSVAVEVTAMKEKPDIVYVEAVIYVERDSQKGILIGSKGSMLKEIGAKARADIEGLLDTKIFLDLWVKVKKDWRNEERALKQLGYREEF